MVIITISCLDCTLMERWFRYDKVLSANFFCSNAQSSENCVTTESHAVIFRSAEDCNVSKFASLKKP